MLLIYVAAYNMHSILNKASIHHSTNLNNNNNNSNNNSNNNKNSSIIDYNIDTNSNTNNMDNKENEVSIEYNKHVKNSSISSNNSYTNNNVLSSHTNSGLSSRNSLNSNTNIQLTKRRSILSDVTQKIENKQNTINNSYNSNNNINNITDNKSNNKKSNIIIPQRHESDHNEIKKLNDIVNIDFNEENIDDLTSYSEETKELHNDELNTSNDTFKKDNSNQYKDSNESYIQNTSNQETNEYSAVEEDDDNLYIKSPIEPIYDESTQILLDECYRKYYRSVPDPMDEDTYDVVMVSELSNEIFSYLKTLEEKYKPDPNYMHYQKELKWSYRRILLDWIVEVHNRFQLLPETLYLTVNIIDRFLSKKSIILDKFQLVGASALFIAAKYEEINCPSLKDIIYMLNGTYTGREIIEAERFIIDSLEFEIGWPGPMSFLRKISKADDYEYDIRTLAKYLLESTIMDSKLVSAKPSWLAAGAYFLSKVILGYNTWSQKHIYYSNYTQQQILPLASMILDNCRDATSYHNAIFEKYSHRRFGNCSQIVSKWIATTEKKIRKIDSDNDNDNTNDNDSANDNVEFHDKDSN